MAQNFLTRFYSPFELYFALRKEKKTHIKFFSNSRKLPFGPWGELFLINWYQNFNLKNRDVRKRILTAAIVIGWLNFEEEKINTKNQIWEYSWY